MKDLRKQNETTTIQRDGLPSNRVRLPSSPLERNSGFIPLFTF
ncbi:hypothetical protein OAZ21_02040 [Bacteroidota bacterium]|nr:hypothetical protein [Bacteroidota bacterium]